MVRYYVASNAFNNVKEIMESLSTTKKLYTILSLFFYIVSFNHKNDPRYVIQHVKKETQILISLKLFEEKS